MAYKRSFRYLRTHLLAERPLAGELPADRETVFGALRAGRAYIAIDSIAPAHGFRFWAEGEGELQMGDEAASGTWTLHVESPQQARLVLVRDGAEVARTEGKRLQHRAEGQGVYRIEAYLEAYGRERTWVLSNPIYLR
jgi:hypothetical protein